MSRPDHRPQSYTTEDVLDAINQVLEEGDRDLWEGGASTAAVAERLPIGESRTARMLRRLCDEDVVAHVDGAHPETGVPRKSWLPADHPDAEQRGGRFEHP